MRIVFIGTGQIGVPALRSLLRSTDHKLVGLLTQPDKAAGRSQILTAPATKTALEGTSIPILQPNRIKSQEAVEKIRTWGPDVIVVIAYGQILPREVLELSRVACLNLHASLLPRHRGATPIQAAIVAGDCESGITVIYMDEGLDTGDILLQRKLEISPNETGASLHDRLAGIAPAAMEEALKLLNNGIAPRIPQDPALATYAPKLARKDGKIDWSEPAEVIERKIRAFNPWPGAFMLITEKSGQRAKLKIFQATIIDAKGKPGEIVCANDSGLAVGTNDRAVLLQEVQPEGRRRMSGAEFARGQRWIDRSADDAK
jgi:methionyl-tRNA formyltransferase